MSQKKTELPFRVVYTWHRRWYDDDRGIRASDVLNKLKEHFVVGDLIDLEHSGKVGHLTSYGELSGPQFIRFEAVDLYLAIRYKEAVDTWFHRNMGYGLSSLRGKLNGRSTERVLRHYHAIVLQQVAQLKRTRGVLPDKTLQKIRRELEEAALKAVID